jgi:4-hydroxy-tetrahydrodipicolinate synthase
MPRSVREHPVPAQRIDRPAGEPLVSSRGHLSCVSNFAPGVVAALYDAFAAGDRTLARQLHYELHPLVDAAFAETIPVPAKWIMRRMGLLESDFARPPLAPLSEVGRSRVETLLTGTEVGLGSRSATAA